MGAKIIDLVKYRRDKELEKIREEARQSNVKDDIRASLDNDLVMKRYKINPPEISLEERTDRLAKSISRINKLMKELEDNNR